MDQEEIKEAPVVVTSDEWLEISHHLEQHHAIFYRLWQMGKPVLTESIETAAVQFDPEGEWVDFMFNPYFWASLDLYERCFVISHEALHVILNHGTRTRDAKDHDKANRALDIVVNHSLVNNFGFDRSKIRDADTICWVDTVFKDHPDLENIPTNESFEYYVQRMPDGGETFLLDAHDFLAAGGNPAAIIDKIAESLTPEQREALGPFMRKHSEDEKEKEKTGGGGRAATGTGRWMAVSKAAVPKKKKWETVITKWSLKHLRNDIEEKEQWARLGRRLTLLPADLMLPSEVEDDYFKKDRLPVFFYLDTSGSCIGYKDRFFKAAKSLPTERFNMRLFCFDTEIKETTLASGRVYGGGGTSFDIIETHIQKTMKEEKLDYPAAVFLITDGYGNPVKPMKPENWYWFLTPYNSTSFIHEKSKRYNLKDFE